MSITPKNWASFQHYKERKPAWIKLHRELLDNYEFACLPVASRALAPCLWLLASEYQGGEITASLEEIAFRLRMPKAELCEALHPLVEVGFFILSNDVADCKQDASNALADRKQSAMPEKERETEVETEKDAASRTDFESEPELFRRGKEIFGPSGGGLTAKLLKAKGGKIALARAALEIAATKENPREYIGAAIKKRDGPEQSDTVIINGRVRHRW